MNAVGVVVGVAVLLGVLFLDGKINESGANSSDDLRKWKQGELEIRGGSHGWYVLDMKTLEVVFRDEDLRKCWDFMRGHVDYGNVEG